ncbi:hypothetical protein PC9H_009141 [Pleurotus ostreatus]|uniref:Uncharacterized protein n=1 Tax=Pleurotus ostreatus TaxID=5322 RepID=A0A8H6ZSG5_PLEOS|nr:uncharacterized protein PC9H_009141 [Pleurotus ostreatus]KAF7426772.1 hypothetical protein PC9H_009141 [Pleurotus ostreatus]
MGSARLRECSFLFFGVMDCVFGEEFAAYLPSVVPPSIASCKQVEQGDENLSIFGSEGSAVCASGSSPANAIAIMDEVDAHGNASIELEDVDVGQMVDVNNAIAIEKEIATDTIGTLFASTRNHFLPHVEQCTVELIDLLDH